MSLNANEHRLAMQAEVKAGEITLYRLNKATYDAIEYIHATGRTVTVTRNGKPLATITPVT